MAELICSSGVSGFQTFKPVFCIYNKLLTVINASAAVTLLEQRPEKNSGSERDSNPRPLRCQCSALPTELSKPHESGRMRVSPLNVDVILGPSITSTFKGLTRIRPLSCGFDSSVGRALHWHRRGRGFESRSEPEFFPGLCSSSVTAGLDTKFCKHSPFGRVTPKMYSPAPVFTRQKLYAQQPPSCRRIAGGN